MNSIDFSYLKAEVDPVNYDYSGININNRDELLSALSAVLEVSGNDQVKIKDEDKLRNDAAYLLTYVISTTKDKTLKDSACRILINAGKELGIKSRSIQKYYEEKANGKDANITIPAINVRGVGLYWTRGAIRAQIATKRPQVIFELAISEAGYTEQSKLEQVAMVFAGYITLGFKNMDVYIQGDHYQIKAGNFDKAEFEKTGTCAEMEKLKKNIQEAVEAGIYNIDIDTSTLELSREEAGGDAKKREELNAKVSAQLVAFIRDLEKQGKTDGEIISIGSEVGEVGHDHTTPEEVDGYFELLEQELHSIEEKQGLPKGSLIGPSKMSINIGTEHGGVTDPVTGKLITDVPIRVQTHSEIYNGVKNRFSGNHTITVQHGASTLSLDKFNLFSQHHVAEVHLATGYQNIWLDILREKNPDILKEVDEWLLAEPTLESERNKYKGQKYSKDGSLNKDEFLYRNYKRCFGPFKKQFLTQNFEILKQFEEECYKFNKELFIRLAGETP